MIPAAQHLQPIIQCTRLVAIIDLLCYVDVEVDHSWDTEERQNCGDDASFKSTSRKPHKYYFLVGLTSAEHIACM